MAEYIEREALWRAFEYEPFYNNADRDEIVLPKIDYFPSADVAPVVHGRWIKCEDGTCYCSECNQNPQEWYERAIKALNYCPNCGAIMDKEDD